MTARVLVTRSQPGAGETAVRLAALGYQPIVEPLFGLEPLAAEIPGYDALAFTSANGVRAFAERDARRDGSVFVVGERTAQAARDAGFAAVVSAHGDVAALANLLIERLAPGARVLHAGNEDARGDLKGRLNAAGLNAAFVPLYRAVEMTTPQGALKRHLSGQERFDAVLIHSPRAAAILAGFLKSSPSSAHVRAAAISAAAAAPLAEVATAVACASTPDESSLMVALERLLARS